MRASFFIDWRPVDEAASRIIPGAGLIDATARESMKLLTVQH
jgi:hypothetical protein